MSEPVEDLPAFDPCASYCEEARHTEIVLKDVPIVWVDGIAFDLGYDFNGDLVAMRVPGDVTRR